MLGEKIGEEKGKITGQRVIENPNGGVPRIEVTFEAQGRLLNVEANSVGTYWAEAREGGTFYGQGQGVLMTKDGEVVAWQGNGIGRPTGKGRAMAWRGAIYYRVAPNSKLARLNGVAAIFEHDTDDAGNSTSTTHEWR